MTTGRKLYFIGIICLLSYPLIAQDNLDNRRLGLAVKTDILAAALSESQFGVQAFSFSVEKLIGKKQSFQLSGYYGYNNRKLSFNPSRYRAFQIIPEYRFYVNKKNYHKGIYCGIYSGLLSEKELIPSVNYENTSRYLELGALSGYQIYLFKHIAVDFLFGLGAKNIIYYKIISPDGVGEGEGFNLKPLYSLDARLSLNIGYLFY